MAVTVEELQILLSCDAAQAEAVLDAITKKVDSAVKKMQGKLDGAMDGGGTGGSKKQTSYYDALVKKISTAREKMNEALSSMQNGTEGADVNYNHWSQQVDSLTKRLEKLRDTQKDVNETAAEMRDIPIQYPQQSKGGYQPWSRPVENWQASQERSRDAMRYIESDQRQASRVDTEKLAYGTPYEKLHEQFVRASEKVDELAAKLRQLQEEGGSPKAIDALESKLETASNKADRLAEKMAKIEDKATGGNGAGEDIKQTGDAAQEATPKIESYNRALGKTSKAQGLFSRIGKASHKMFDKFGHSFKKHDGLLSQFGKTLKRVIMRMLAMALIRGTLRAISEGMTLLGKASNEAQKQLNRFKAMGNSVKTAFGSAALAALTALAPVLYQIASAAIYAANAIARFFAVLGGGSYFAVNMADNFDDIGEAAGGAGGKVKGLLADFDELNVIGQQGGGGGGGGSLGGTTVTEETPQSILAELLNDGLFYEAGQYVAEKLRDISARIDEWFIELDNQHYGKKFAEFINGFLADKTVFEGLGKTTGDGLNLIIHAIDDFVTEFNGLQFGTNIAAYLNGIFDTVDFVAIGHSLAEGLTNIGDAIIGFFTELDFGQIASDISDWLISFCDTITNWLNDTDWREFGNTLYKNIKDFLTNVDWLGIAKAVFNLLGSALNASVLLIFGFFEGIWNDIKNWWTSSGVGDWFQNNIIDPIREGFEFAIGTVVRFFKICWYSIEEGAIYLWIGILEVAKAIALAFANAWDAISYGAKVIWWALEYGFAAVINAIVGCINDMIDGINWALGWTGVNIEHLKGITVESFEEIGENSHEAAKAVEEAFSGSINGAEGKIDELQGKIDSLNAEQAAAKMKLAKKSVDDYSSAIKNIPSSKTTNIKVNVTTTSSGSGGGSGGGTTVRPTVNVNMAMASGGLAYGETLARIGEYPNARSNPEVVAPLDKLQGILERTGGGSNSKDVREQNALLREQNRLLQIIAKKKLEVSPTPELGQVVTRAQALYGEV